MNTGESPGTSLTEDQARKLAHDFIESGLRLVSTLTGHPPSPDDLVWVMQAGIASVEFLRPVLGDSHPLAQPTESNEEVKALILSRPAAEVMERIESELTNEFLKATPETSAKWQSVVDKLKEWSHRPTWPREALVGFAKQQWPGKPGPTPKVPREVYPELVAKAASLRPVCEMVLDFRQNKSEQPLPKIIEAVVLLHPEWEPECSFMLSYQELVQEALGTAKIKRALGPRSKAHLLADALACSYSGHPASPSYSIQVVAEARRLSKP